VLVGAEGRAARRASRLLARALTHRPDSPPAAGAGRALRRRGGTPVRSSERGGVRPRTALAEQGDLPSDYAMEVGRTSPPRAPRSPRLGRRCRIAAAAQSPTWLGLELELGLGLGPGSAVRVSGQVQG